MHLEIACDESGFSGGNLVGRGHSPMFAHASIRIDGPLIDHESVWVDQREIYFLTESRTRCIGFRKQCDQGNTPAAE
jgi:hypothetical protein